MKSTGIVRRVDDLGRIVIPKETRNTLGISEGDPLEMYVEDGAIVYRKYSPAGDYAEQIRRLMQSIEEDGDISPETREAVAGVLGVLIAELEATP